MYEDIYNDIERIKNNHPDVTDDEIEEVLSVALDNLSKRLDKKNYLKIDTMFIGSSMLNKIGYLARNFTSMAQTDALTYDFLRWLIDHFNQLKDVEYKQSIAVDYLGRVAVDFSHDGEHYILKIKQTQEEGYTKDITEKLYIFDNLNSNPIVANKLIYKEDTRDGRRRMENESEKFENWNDMSPLSEREQKFVRSLIQMNPVFEATLNNNFEYYHKTSYGFSEHLEKKTQDSPVTFISIGKIDKTNLINLIITPQRASVSINLDENGMVPLTSEIYNKLHIDNAIAGEIRSILQAAASFGTDVISDIPTGLYPQQGQETVITLDSQSTGITPSAYGESDSGGYGDR